MLNPNDLLNLIRRCQTGDEKAWAELMKEYEHKWKRYWHRLCHGDEELEDEFFSGCFKIFNGLDKFHVKGDIHADWKNWCQTVLLNHYRDILRPQKLNIPPHIWSQVGNSFLLRYETEIREILETEFTPPLIGQAYQKLRRLLETRTANQFMYENKDKLLAVSDYRDMVKMLKQELEATSYTVIVAYEGKEGVEKAKQKQPDAIILDFTMPEQAGFEAYRQLSNNPECVDIPILALTTPSQRFSHCQYASSIGLHVPLENFIDKPVHLNIYDKPVEIGVLVERLANLLLNRLSNKSQKGQRILRRVRNLLWIYIYEQELGGTESISFIDETGEVREREFEDASPISDELDEEFLEAVEKCINQIQSPDQRSVVKLKLFTPWSNEKIAQVLDIPKLAVERHWSRGNKKLQNIMADNHYVKKNFPKYVKDAK